MKGLLSYFIVLSAFIVVTASCSPASKAPAAVWRYADSLMESHPDSVLDYLCSLDVTGLREADQAYYGLLLTQATDKNYLPLLSCDSMIDVALDYYDEGDGINRARALLYKGRILQEMNMTEGALESCFAALKELGDTWEELRLKRMLYEDLGGIYQEQFLEEKALEMYQLSYQCDSLLHDERLLMYSLSNLGWASIFLNDTEMADKYLNKALRLALGLNDSSFISDTYSKLSANSENIDSAFIYSRLALQYQKSKDPTAVFIDLGQLFLEKQQPDSAEYYLTQALNSADFKRKISIYHSLSELENQKGNYKQAFDYLSFYGEHVDSLFSLNRASEIERLAYKYEAEAEALREKARTEKVIQLVIFASVVLLLTCLLIIQRIHRRKKVAKLVYEQSICQLNKMLVLLQQKIKHSEEDLIRLQEAQEQNKEEIALKEQEIRRMIDEKAKLCNWFFMQTPIYKRIEELAKQNDISQKEARVLLQSEQLLLKETLFQIYVEYVEYLQLTYPKLTEEDCMYHCLQLCQLNDQTIAYCFGNTSKQIVAQRRLRLKKKMEIES